MKIVTANGSKSLKITKSEWLEIGKKAGWDDGFMTPKTEAKDLLAAISSKLVELGRLGKNVKGLPKLEEVIKMLDSVYDETVNPSFSKETYVR